MANFPGLWKFAGNLLPLRCITLKKKQLDASSFFTLARGEIVPRETSVSRGVRRNTRDGKGGSKPRGFSGSTAEGTFSCKSFLVVEFKTGHDVRQRSNASRRIVCNEERSAASKLHGKREHNFMKGIKTSSENVCAIFIDMGTTNTRGWLLRGREIIARASRPVGVRETARDGSSVKIQAGIKEIVDELDLSAKKNAAACSPACVVAAGMISSSLGLVEVPHVHAPAGAEEIAALSLWRKFPELFALPILLIAGVRCGAAGAELDSIYQTDVMRGEEALCVGLVSQGRAMPLVVLNLGSHWKAIKINGEGKIVSSSTSLAGELIHAAQTQTVLASSLPKGRASAIEKKWLHAGLQEARRSGLPRALFCVRLLELAGEGAPEDRLSFLIGVFIAADLDALMSRGILTAEIPIVIVGADGIAEAWHEALMTTSLHSTVLDGARTEEALLNGMRYILDRAWQRRT